MSFVHLHLHTEYSLLDAVIKIKPLIEQIKAKGMSACAITDHGVMYGMYEFWMNCKEAGIKPIIGCEIYVANRSRFDKVAGVDNQRYHLTLLAKNQKGLKNLLKIVSLAHTEGFYYKPRADKELLKKYGEGIIALTGCLGSNFNTYLLNQDIAAAEEWVEYLVECFDKVYVELQRNGIKESSDLIPTQLKIAKKFKLDYVATCDTHYIEEEDHKIQEIAWCIADGKKLADPERRQYGSTQFYLKSPEEMEQLFEDLPDAVTNTQVIADSIEDYNLEYSRVQPKFDSKLSIEATRELLKEHTTYGAEKRYGKLTTDLQNRINYELEIIDQKGYNDYFLVVEDYVQWAKNNNILVGPGRGSGAGSVVAYSLGITNIDPLRFDLIFERFLNPERPSPPDFDIDFQDDRRDELFEYMTQRYGADHTSFVGTFGRLKTKAAIRDVARVMDIDLKTADTLSKMVIVKFGRVHSIKMMRSEVKEFDEMIKSEDRLEELAKFVSKIENIARHVSIHACGYLVTPNAITDYVPVQIETKGGDKIVTQIEGHFLEPMGLMKFDFLGLSNLTVIGNTIKYIKLTQNQDIDIDTISLTDKKTYKLFQNGDTTGIFQFESEGMKKYLKDLKPTEFEDLIFLNAAYRPGPMMYIPEYIARKQGKKKVTYLHETIEPILKNTYGFAIYQEQVINIAVTFAGYSLGEADILRRAMGKKKPEVMAKERDKFITKSVAKGHPEKLASEVFSYLEPFADYGFNRSHSACYSLIAYQTAYLKAHFPTEFMAGLMESNLNNIEKLEKDLTEARAMGIEILAPHVNYSDYKFRIAGDNQIRIGLGGIKGCGEKSVKYIINEREEKGEYKSLADFFGRIDTASVSKKDLECLVKVGALDNFGYTRNQLLLIIPAAVEQINRLKKLVINGQSQLFTTDDSSTEMQLPQVPNTQKETNLQKLNWEKEMLGVFVSDHPLNDYLDLYKHGISKVSDLASQVNKRTKVLGIIVQIKKIYSKKDGKPMAFITIEDTSTKVEGVVFSKIYDKVKESLVENQPLVLSVLPQERPDGLSLMIDDIISPGEADVITELVINITQEKDPSKIEKLKTIITNNPGETKLKIIYGSYMDKKEIIKQVNLNTQVRELVRAYSS